MAVSKARFKSVLLGHRLGCFPNKDKFNNDHTHVTSPDSGVWKAGVAIVSFCDLVAAQNGANKKKELVAMLAEKLSVWFPHSDPIFALTSHSLRCKHKIEQLMALDQ